MFRYIRRIKFDVARKMKTSVVLVLELLMCFLMSRRYEGDVETKKFPSFFLPLGRSVELRRDVRR